MRNVETVKYEPSDSNDKFKLELIEVPKEINNLQKISTRVKTIKGR